MFSITIPWYYSLAILVSVSPVCMHSIIYLGVHRCLAYRSHSPEQAQRAVHFKPAFTHLQRPTQPFVQQQ